MQLEATDWSIRPTLVVHPQGFTPHCAQTCAVSASALVPPRLSRETENGRQQRPLSSQPQPSYERRSHHGTCTTLPAEELHR